MRRWALLLAGGAVWLLLAAVPVLADGGPHQKDVNSGKIGGITADSCAGCHRAHTAQARNLLVEEEPELCYTCHDSAGTGAVTDVEDGLQYSLASDGSRTSPVLGALRGGGFEFARIGSGSAARLSYLSGSSVRQLPKVPVSGDAVAVTSTHLGAGIQWGNGPISATANPGGTVSLECSACHNPHGNGQYRILRPQPQGEDPVGIVPGASPAPVDDPVATIPPNDARNYTVIQVKGTEGTDSSFLLFASQLAGYSNGAGDYFHRRVPWNSSSGMTDAPNGKPSTFNTQITAWCSYCHTRYAASVVPNVPEANSGDAIYKFRHTTTTNKACTTCHVAHGSNAQMTGLYSGNFPWPGNAAPASNDSRLLKIDNRGTCQACHDPTLTTVAGDFYGPTPSPYLP